MTNPLAARAYEALSGLIGTVAGITPHVLHHIGPVVGAAFLTGTEGSIFFGVVGFVFMFPTLFRLKKRFGTWTTPGVALALFFVTFTISTLWIGPAIRGNVGPIEPTPVDTHHPAAVTPISAARG